MVLVGCGTASLPPPAEPRVRAQTVGPTCELSRFDNNCLGAEGRSSVPAPKPQDPVCDLAALQHLYAVADGVLRGLVCDAATHATIPAALVTIDGSTGIDAELTDEHGQFVVTYLAPGHHMMAIREGCHHGEYAVDVHANATSSTSTRSTAATAVSRRMPTRLVLARSPYAAGATPPYTPDRFRDRPR